MKIPGWLKSIYFTYFFRVKKGKCLFIPHPGFCKYDYASIINYKADNCLIFVRYILDNNLYFDKELVVVSTTIDLANKEQDFCNRMYPNANIKIIPDISSVKKTEWASSQYIVKSECSFLIRKKKGQKYICLSYYPVSLKNDYYDASNPKFENKIELAKQVDIVASSSLINSQIESASFFLPFHLFKPIGKCRTDILQQKEDLSFIKRDLFNKFNINYVVSKIILYTPTHRDYESATFDIKRSILGFDVDRNRFEKFIVDNGLLIICKLHPAQNMAVIDCKFIRGVINFTGSMDYGLIELMKISDILMTDYTSTYVDYLLLGKSVIFNLYDLESYKLNRGLAFYPFEEICAGELFDDESSFYRAVKNTLDMPNKYIEKQKRLLETFITYKTNVCEETYKLIFANNN